MRGIRAQDKNICEQCELLQQIRCCFEAPDEILSLCIAILLARLDPVVIVSGVHHSNGAAARRTEWWNAPARASATQITYDELDGGWVRA